MTNGEKIICKNFLHDADNTRSCNEYKLLMELLEQEPTTKNNLGVDCISRIETIDYLCKHCPDDGECFKDCDEIKRLRQMPSVTPQEPSWIPVTERLPDKDGLYLVSVKNDHERRYSKTCWYSDKNWFARRDTVAWMPLPEPYNAESEE